MSSKISNKELIAWGDSHHISPSFACSVCNLFDFSCDPDK
jgi:hypothetical protein